MTRLTDKYIKRSITAIDEFLETALQENKRLFAMQRVRQARQAIAGLTAEIDNQQRKGKSCTK